MDILPSDIRTIVNRYVFNTVLNQLVQSFGSSLRLKYISIGEEPSRIHLDAHIVTYCEPDKFTRLWYHPNCDDNKYYDPWWRSVYIPDAPHHVNIIHSRPLWLRHYDGRD